VCDRMPRGLSLRSRVAQLTIVTPGKRHVTRNVRMSITRGTSCLTVPSVARGQLAHVVIRTVSARTSRGTIRNDATAVAGNAPTVRASRRVAVVRGARLPAVTG